jgi:putative ABC transport system substrate-binding protein
MMSRRQFVAGMGASSLGLLAGCGRLPGQAQAPAKIARIGYLAANSTSPAHQAFREELRELGWIEGQNILVEWRSPNTPEEWGTAAAELVRLPVDVILAPSGVAALAAKQATSTIPIVFVTAGDPVGSGLVDSLARPGGNVTGVSSLNAPLGAKRLELLKQAAPRTSRVACLYDASGPAAVAESRLLVEAAGPLGVTVEALGVQAPEDVERAFEVTTQLPADALVTTQGQFLFTQRQRIVDFAARNRLPAIYAWRDAVDSGGLMSYGPNPAAQFRRAAHYVDRLIKGAKPADLPVEQPMRFDFVVNMKTARELGITFPNEIMLQVTEVIQ